jgi:hypothetical protein
MKKLFNLLVLFAFIISKSLTANPVNLNSTPPGPVITFEFDFNSKKSNCMEPFGFCKFSVSVHWENKPTGGNSVRGSAFINSSNQLIITVNVDNLKSARNGAYYNYLRNRTSITIDDAYALSPEANRALGASSPIVIKPGEYKVLYENNEYKIIIPL